jgi:hypothetical protein
MTKAKDDYTKVWAEDFGTKVQREAERRGDRSNSEERYDWGHDSVPTPTGTRNTKRAKFSGTGRHKAEDLELTVASENVAKTSRSPPPSPQVASGPPSSPIQTPQTPTILQRMMSFGSPKTSCVDTSPLSEADSRKEHYLSDYEVTGDGKSTLTRRGPAGSFTL